MIIKGLILKPILIDITIKLKIIWLKSIDDDMVISDSIDV